MERKRKPFKHSTTFYRRKKILSNSKIDHLLQVLEIRNTKSHNSLEPCPMQYTSPNYLSNLREVANPSNQLRELRTILIFDTIKDWSSISTLDLLKTPFHWSKWTLTLVLINRNFIYISIN